VAATRPQAACDTAGTALDSSKDGPAANDFASLPSAPSADGDLAAPGSQHPPDLHSAPAKHAAAPRFQPGNKVIYSSSGEAGDGGVKGTVARMVSEGNFLLVPELSSSAVIYGRACFCCSLLGCKVWAEGTDPAP
jgi:hypothetical protein